MSWLQHNEGKYTFLDRTHHRDEGGGFELWMFEVRGKKYFYQGDIRIPGVLNSAVQGLPEDREKVIVVDFVSEEALNSVDVFQPTHTSGYEARLVMGCIVELSIRIIEPIRKYRYVAMVSDITNKMGKIHKRFARRLGTPANQNIVDRVYEILNPDLKTNIDMGIGSLSVGDLISNPDWRKNNNLPPL